MIWAINRSKMNYLKHRIIIALGLCLMAFWCVSCSGDDDMQGDDTRKIRIKFTLTMDDRQADSRAGTWGDNDYDTETAATWESTINYGKLQVLVYSMKEGYENTYIGEVSDLTFSRLNSGSQYTIVGSFLANIGSGYFDADGNLPCKLVVFANYDSTIGTQAAGADISAIKETTYNYSAAGIAAHTSYIPMWGVRTYTDEDGEYKPLTLETKTKIDAGEIFMLRSMAKIRVKLNDYVAANYTLSNVTLSNYSYLGYIMPAGYSISDTEKLYHADQTADDQPATFNPYLSNNSRLSLAFTEEEEGKSFVVYVPEFETTADDTGATDPYIALTLTPVNLAQSPLEFSIQLNKDDGTPQRLVRNTVYTYTIVGTDLAIEYQAQSWDDKGGNITFD